MIGAIRPVVAALGHWRTIASAALPVCGFMNTTVLAAALPDSMGQQTDSVAAAKHPVLSVLR